MPQEEDTQEQAALSAWKKKREERRRRQEQQQQQQDDSLLLSTLVEDNTNDNPDRNTDVEEEDTFVPLAKRLKLEEEELLKKRGLTHRSKVLKKHGGISNVSSEDNDEDAKAETKSQASQKKIAKKSKTDTREDDGEEEEALTEEQQQQQVESLLESAAALHDTLTEEERAEKLRKEEEERIMKEASKVQKNSLQGASELAQGVRYQESLPSTWTAPRYILEQGEDAWNKVRKEWHMEIEGTDIPPPMKRFKDMKFPKPLIDYLDKKGMKRPTPIQMQGLPVALASRDMIGIAFTGSGKTLTFSLPLVMAALEEELRMPLVPGEGPVGIILAPSRELARQTYDVVTEFCEAISAASGYPSLRTQLLIGGESVRDQLSLLQSAGVHCVVATPGRLRDVLKRKSMTLSICRYICLDEADRMLDLGFDEEVGEIMNHFPHQRQTLLFSATFPKKFQDFARETLVKPIVVNVGRAGAANLDVIQEVEYVKQEAKIVYLLHCLQKTAPPVVIFCERKGDVDDIHEYLLLKGVEAVSIHGGKDQEERNEAIRLYKEGKKDVLVATDVAAKGLDFSDIQHVINFDMPSEIENYVHRIGRTGRCGKTGVATTFINKSCEETTLLDLKHLLKEARQRIPPVLMMLDDPRDANGGAGCSYCGGLGHTIVDCPKIDKNARQVASGRKDALATGGGYGGDW